MTKRKTKFTKLEIKKQERIREIIHQRLTEAMMDVERATGYLASSSSCILQDDLAKSLDVEIDIALIVRPHDFQERKVKHYIKFNPHNCLNEPVMLFQYDGWYEIYNGVHRTEANRRLGKKKIKANIIAPDKETLEQRNLLD